MGAPAWPYAGLDGGRFAFAADAGAGLALSLTSSFALSLEGHATLVTPYPVIRFLEVDTAEIRSPLLSRCAHAGGAAMKAAWLVVFLVGCGPTAYRRRRSRADDARQRARRALDLRSRRTAPILEDDSGNRRDGTISGATFTNDGRFGGALHFRRGDSVTVDNFPDATASWSFSAWIRISDEDIATDDSAR